MILGITDDGDTSAVFGDGIALGDIIGGVVSAFSLNLGANLADDGADIELGKDHDRVDIFQRGNDFGTFLFRHDGASCAFERAHGFVGVHGHDQLASERLGPAQVAYVANVEQVEVAVRQRDAFAGAPPFCDTLPELIAADDLVVSDFAMGGQWGRVVGGA